MTRSAPRPELGQAREQGLHNIGEAAALSGVSAKMIRHYESIGLIPAAARTFAGYRLYNDSDVHRLRFVKRSRASAEVKQLASRHADELGQRIAEMQAMQRTLQELARRCHGNDRPDCPILDDLSGGAAPES